MPNVRFVLVFNDRVGRKDSGGSGPVNIGVGVEISLNGGWQFHLSSPFDEIDNLPLDTCRDKRDKGGPYISKSGIMYRPGLNELEAVLAIAREGSFRGAALALGMSTTALSNAVAKLESNLGARLFNRTTRSVSLSDAGRAFVEQVSPAVRDIQSAMEGVRSQQQTPSGMLRINAFAAGAREIMSPLVIEFVRRYPDVHVDIVTEGRLVDIVADGFDLGMRRDDLVPADMVALSLGRP